MSKIGQSVTMKKLPVCERPYEKLEGYGPEMLSNAELLAIIIKTGTRNETSVSLAQKIIMQLEDSSITSLHGLSLEQLRNIRGIGKVKAIQIKAMLEFSKRMASAFITDRKKEVNSPGDISSLLMEEMRHLKKEVFKVVLMNSKNRIIRHVNVSVGSLTASIVHPREVFCEAVKAGCSGIIFAHNHPSGDPEPSQEDVETTGRLIAGGNILGIRVLDHIIIGDGRYVSLKERGLM
ncbi:DNA replication and repair protein RadC [Anaerobacterium chartisolvens]|uniref:DNA replication and repair protein RadC n=1 Tax=Anaerobacterium chartisolvens TaxID=1297424 RepID=A0A369BGY0_9FIRM|nr:DNA repair protein RadC [Anaerobacterium chartisolvens]RCX20812.1 DNA replication and repair protein RadC [Anaerobacterium chartisolvens]